MYVNTHKQKCICVFYLSRLFHVNDDKPFLPLQINECVSDAAMAHFQSVKSVQGNVHISVETVIIWNSAAFCLLLTAPREYPIATLLGFVNLQFSETTWTMTLCQWIKFCDCNCYITSSFTCHTSSAASSKLLCSRMNNTGTVHIILKQYSWKAVI